MKNSIVAFFSACSKLPVTKIVCLVAVFLQAQHQVKAQQLLFSEDFESKILSPAWQPVSGNWHIADVQEKRIAPAENGNQYVLSSGGAGFLRLLVDIPDTTEVKQVKESFSYYTYAKGPGAIAEIEFHEKDLKDGLKGKMLKIDLPVKGRWVVFQKLIKRPAGANRIWITFYENWPVNKTSKTVCFDNIILTSVH